PVVMPPSSGDMGQRACEGGAPGVLTRSVERSRVPAGSIIDHEAPGEQDGRATSSAQSQRVLAQSQGVFGTRTDPVRVARPPPSRPLVPDLLGQHLVLVNGTKSFTIPDWADDSNPNMLCVTTARLRVLAHVPSSSAYLPMPHRACVPVHAPHAPSSSAKLLFWTRISTTSQGSAGVLGVVLGVVLGGGARSQSSKQWWRRRRARSLPASTPGTVRGVFIHAGRFTGEVSSYQPVRSAPPSAS